MNKKALMDVLDLLFTVFMLFFLLLFISIFMNSTSDNNEIAITYIMRDTHFITSNINDQRIILEQGSELDFEELNRQIIIRRDLRYALGLSKFNNDLPNSNEE